MSNSSGIKTNALAASGAGANVASSSVGTAMPLYQQLAQGNTGLTSQQQANMLTASAQSLGGGQSAATGAANLAAARTGNVGGYGAAIDDAARQAGVQQSANALGVQDESASIARQNQAQGLAGLSNLYQTGSGNQISALNTANQAARPFWQTALLASIQSAGQVGAAAAGG